MTKAAIWRFPQLDFRTWAPRPISQSASAHLDLIRGIAALAVMWGHVRTLYFVDYQSLRIPSWLIKIIYFATGFGHQAVMVFFVLSGCLISSTVIKTSLFNTWSWRNYAINRATRLYVVLIPGLVLGLVWDSIGSSLLEGNGIYKSPIAGLGPAIPLENLTLKNFIGNLFYLQTIMCPTFGSNGPLWSLTNEFWYYVLFPLGLSAGIGWRKRTQGYTIHTTVLTILTIGVCVFVGRGILMGFLVWLAGCALALSHGKFQIESKLTWTLGLALSLLLFSGALSATRIGKISEKASDILVGTAFALFLFFVLQGTGKTVNVIYSQLARLCAGFSYSLYVLHFPFLLFLRACVTPKRRWVPDTSHLVCGFLVGVAALTFAWSVSLFTERKTGTVRAWAMGLFGSKVVP